MQTLPEKYYLDHFNEFVAYTERYCSGLLLAKHRQLIQQFHQLEHNAQCMLVRVINRRGALIARSNLDYSEIEDCAGQLNQLIRQGLLRPVAPRDMPQLLASLNKKQIIELLLSRGVSFKKSVSKTILVTLAQQLDATDISEHSVVTDYSVKTFVQQWQYLLFLFFGNLTSGLDKFSMRDLGVLKTRNKIQQQGPRFSTLDEAQSSYFFARQIQALPNMSEQQLIALSSSQLFKQPPQGALALEYAANLYYLLGSALWPISQSTALACWKQSTHQKAQERWIRETYKVNQEQAKLALKKILEAPHDDELSLFAFDFYQRKFNQAKLSIRTARLRANSRKLYIDEIFKNRVENGVKHYYLEHKVLAYRSENRLFNALFGLTFWAELFEGAQRATCSEFDRRPRLIRENRLYTELAEQVEQRLSMFEQPQQALQYIMLMASRHYGQPNGMFRWHGKMLEVIGALIKHVNGRVLILHLRAMAKNYQGLKDGYPDLLVIENNRLRFEEIKAPGDQLRANQLVSIDALQSAGFEVGLCQVEWRYNPQQVYVVVDVETTGGCRAGQRITEIGAVKIIDGKVVESWSSLINPQRSIPKFITRLTGINNAMVQAAPLFCEVLDSFENFIRGAIFVAHNVNFDYGFFKLEYARLERQFRMPKLCTVREMRKYFPGSPSYSLGKLSRDYGLRLDNHHRALCDAQAAAELLIMVNQKKQSLWEGGPG